MTDDNNPLMIVGNSYNGFEPAKGVTVNGDQATISMAWSLPVVCDKATSLLLALCRIEMTAPDKQMISLKGRLMLCL